MSEASWDRLQQLFEAALARDRGAGNPLLDHEVEPSTRLAVERLLAADRSPWSWLEGSAFDHLALKELGQGWAPGTRLGAWEVTEELGRGGMGVVYLGRRADGLYEQQVAIKCLAPFADSPEFVERFDQERRILAELEHPAIARILDAGLAPDGSPFLVMERVVGLPVDEYCQRGRLPLAARLLLFVQVARAVAFAHRRLIVHCDLKPAHLLVTGDGAPKLLDFGIARFLSADGAGHSRCFTPAYASPEQRAGKSLTTASDLYSLGAVLAKVVRDGPSPPRAWQRDLDAILARCLAEDPAERYTSADALADDLLRLLALRPVEARAGGAGYRFGRWALRNRVPLVALWLVACGAGLLLLRLQREQAAAARERAAAEQVTTFLASLVRGANPVEEEDPSAYVGLEARRARELLLDEASRRATAALQDQPRVRARLLHELGNAYRQLGALQKAAPLLEESWALFASSSPRGTTELVTSGLDLCRLRLAEGEAQRAAAFCREAFVRVQSLARPQPALEAEVANELGLVARAGGDLKTAEAEIGRGLALRRAHLPARHPSLDVSLNNLALVLQENGAAAAAEPLLREVLANRRGRLDADHLLVLHASNNLGSALQDMGRAGEAEELYRDAITRGDRRLGEQHPILASLANNLGSLLLARRDLPAARVQFEAAVSVGASCLGADHPEVARYRHNLGVALYQLGHRTEARREFEAALAIRRERLGVSHPSFGSTLLSLARLELESGAAAAAKARLEAALAEWRAAPPQAPAILERAEALLAASRQAHPPPKGGGGSSTSRTETP